MNGLVRLTGLLALALICSNPASAQQWNGFYAGLNAGAVRTTGSTLAEGRVLGSVNPEGSDFQTTKVLFKETGGSYGVLAGYGWQNGNAVFGLEGDLSSLGVDDHKTLPAREFDGTAVPLSYIRTNQELKWLGTIRARAGYSPSPGWLIYASAGVAVAKVTYTSDTDFSEFNGFEWHYPAAFSRIRSGIAAGAGVEWALGGNLHAKLEYLGCQFGKHSQVATNKTVPAFGADVQYTWSTRLDMLRLGMTYRF